MELQHESLPPRWVRPVVAAEAAGCHPATILGAIRTGRIRGEIVSGLWACDLNEVLEKIHGQSAPKKTELFKDDDVLDEDAIERKYADMIFPELRDGVYRVTYGDEPRYAELVGGTWYWAGGEAVKVQYLIDPLERVGDLPGKNPVRYELLVS